MRCPKCGSEGAAGAWVCGRCDFVLDSSFLGDDILNDPGASSAPASVQTKPVKVPGPSRDELGGDALILGQLGEGDIQSFVSDQTGGFLPLGSDAILEEAPASVYIGGDVAALLTPTSVLRQTADAAGRHSALSKFEAFVFDLIDGRRNLGEVRGRTGLSQGDVRIAAAMLLDKRMVESAAAGLPAGAPRPPVDVPAPLRGHPGGDHTGELPDPDDATRELEGLPPLDEPSYLEGPPGSFDEPRPGAPPAPPPPHAPPLPATPLPATRMPSAPGPPAPPAPAAANPAPGFRPALRAEPLRPIRHTPPPPPKRPVGAPPLASPPRSQAAAIAAPAIREPKARAAEHYELALKDLREGRPARAFSYARMAADADPGEEKYQALLRDWDKKAGAAKASDSDPVAAAQQAEAAGDFDRAIALLQKACAQFTGSAPLHNRLGVLLATRARDFRAAYSASMRAVELEPENATYKSNMMKILARVESDDRPVKDKPRTGLLGGLLKR